MKKRFIEAPASLHVDSCSDCKVGWFDGGELARLQLTYEISPQARYSAEFKRRHEEMTPERKAEFEENLQKLNSEEENLGPLLGDTFLSGLLTLLTGHRRF
jgi:Zn-finger nucleic acid-binding protein